MRSVRRLLPLVVLTALAACTSRGLVVLPDVPDDVAEVVTTGMTRIEKELPAHRSCLHDVTVAGAWELEHRAEYRLDDQVVVLRLPATAVSLEFSLAHEIAHHLEFTCQAHEEIQTLFLLAQGHDPDSSWFEGPSWETTPSEQFATAVAKLVTGIGDPERNVVVTDEALGVVADWAVGRLSGDALRSHERTRSTLSLHHQARRESGHLVHQLVGSG